MIYNLNSSYFAWKECTLDVFSVSGPSKCTQRSIDFFDEMLSRSAIDALKLMCGEYAEEGSDKCQALMAKFNKLTQTKTNWRSPLLPLMELLESFPKLKE